MNSFDEVFEQVKRYINEHELISTVACTTWIDTMTPNTSPRNAPVSGPYSTAPIMIGTSVSVIVNGPIWIDPSIV